uniref:Uncharacterized protein n=1 Tax=Cebus imitator TaxID=2715852 RepID=A0A2K5QBK5_CEBIM
MRHLHSRHCSGVSSEPSSQSGSPSHFHRLGTHWPLLHTKSDSAHVFFTFFSSLPSTQSSSPSHFHNRVIQRPFVHWNWEGSHLAFLPRIRREHSLSRGPQHSASSSQSAQRADVPMVPAWMVPPPPPPPLAPHNKLPALPKGGRRAGARRLQLSFPLTHSSYTRWAAGCPRRECASVSVRA